MSEISRVALFGKLNRLGYQAVEGATVFCKLRGNPYVELVHWLHQILQNQNSDLHRIAEYYKLDPAKLVADMQRALDALPRGASSIQRTSRLPSGPRMAFTTRGLPSSPRPNPLRRW